MKIVENPLIRIIGNQLLGEKGWNSALWCDFGLGKMVGHSLPKGMEIF